MPASLIVEDRHFEYLKIQKGSLDKFSADRAAWHGAYERAVTADFTFIHPFLPKSCRSVLDIGGGLGGIDALLVRKYGTDCEVCVLDGECDEPVMRRHCETFNDMRVTKDFLTKNGVKRFSYLTPSAREPKPFDLVISLGSWCFHYSPSTYVSFVQSCCVPGTTIIIDVRKQKPEWARQLKEMWPLKAVVHLNDKINRMVFCAG